MHDIGEDLRVLVVGCGNMGRSHGQAYHRLAGFEICGLVSRGDSKQRLNNELGGSYPLFDDYATALSTTRPDIVCISTYPDTHEPYAVMAFEAGCHVFIEKPLASTVQAAERVAAAASQTGKKLVVGYILRHHPSWQEFIRQSSSLGKPLVMRMNLNQQSHGAKWKVHQNLMQSLSPIVDCAVHYIDVMCQMSRSRPLQVAAIGVRLSDQVPDWNYNYGQLQIKFEDGSVGWYEAGWGPMVSETAFFIKDVWGPNGSVSIVAKQAGGAGKSDEIDAHTKTEALKIHHSQLNEQGEFAHPDEWINMEDEPDHQALCDREQLFLLKAIREDLDLSAATADAINSLKIALACDQSVKTGAIVRLD